MDRRLKYQEDKELLGLYYKERNEALLGILLNRYLPLVFGVCMKYLKNESDAEEEAQNICLKVIREFRKPRFRVTYFKSWLYQVTKNECLMSLRQRKYKVIPLEEVGDAIPSAQNDDRKLKNRESVFELLEEALGALEEEQQRCVRLFYFEKKSYKEITELTGFSLKQVKSYIQNGRRNIKIYMERNDHE